MQKLSLKGKGEVDYDFKHDILFFKGKNREYKKSIELDNLVLDVDSAGFITGIQILEASKFLKIKQSLLLKIPNWVFEAEIHDGMVEIRLTFKVKERNLIIEKNPILIQAINEKLPDSSLICAA